MKKIFLSLAVISVFSLASCKKDHTCTCTSSVDGVASSTPDVTIYTKSTKGQAKANCLSTTWTSNGSTYKNDCTLK